MDILIRSGNLILVMFLTACSSMNNFNSVYLGVKDLVTTEIYETSDLSKLDIDKNFIASIDSGDEFLLKKSSTNESWKSFDDFTLIIKDGKVIQSIGLEYDFKIGNYKGFKNFKASKSTIEFNNPPSGYMDINFNYTLIKDGVIFSRMHNKEVEYKLIREDFKVDLISWHGSNFYWVDINNNILMTKQLISPFGNKIRISK